MFSSFQLNPIPNLNIDVCEKSIYILYMMQSKNNSPEVEKAYRYYMNFQFLGQIFDICQYLSLSVYINLKHS